METCFTTQADDARGTLAIELLRDMGYTAHVLESSEHARAGEIALFTSPDGKGFRKKPHYLRVCPHKFDLREIPVPKWARETPFLVALRPDVPKKYGRYRINFKRALEQVAQTYQAWSPWSSPAPWNPHWSGEVPAAFQAWRARARELVAPPSMETRVGKHLCPVFAPSKVAHSPTLVVIGCAAFNRPHTDVVNELLPHKLKAVVADLRELVESGGFGRVEVVVPEGDILEHDILRRHLHPFIFMSVAEAESLLGKPFGEATRLCGRTHRRSFTEIREAFDESASAMRRQLVEPLRAGVSVPVQEVSWLGMVRPYLDEAAALVARHEALLEAIYLERVKTRPSYAMLHTIDPVGGLRRTLGNAALYVAEAMHLRDNPECVVANFEVHDTYWRGLEPVIRPLWGERVPYVGMVREQYRQPWGY